MVPFMKCFIAMDQHYASIHEMIHSFGSTLYVSIQEMIHSFGSTLYVLERSGSEVECLTRDRRAVGSSLTGVTALWSLSMTHLS